MLRQQFSKINSKQSWSDRVFDVINLCLMVVLLLVYIWPIWFVVIASFSDPNKVMSGQVLLLPKGLTMKSYDMMLEYKKLWTGYANTILITVVGTVLNLVMSVCLAYPLSLKKFMPKKFILVMVIVTMYFGGGLVPNYLVIRSLGLLNTYWAMIIPGVISVYNSLIIRSYFENSISQGLYEAAMLDGANSAQYLFRIVLPLSKPVLAVVGLYYMVGHWNDYMSALLYIYDTDKYPLQSVVRELLMSTQIMKEQMVDMDPELLRIAMETANTMKYSVIITAALPMLVVYPFIQKFFVKGIMIGSMKG